MEIAEKYKQTDFGNIPFDWSIVRIQDLIDYNIITCHLDGNHGELYPRSNEFKPSGVPYVGANDFYNGEVNFSNCKFLSEERAKQFKKGIAKNGDVLFAHNATVGPVAFLKTDLEYIILSTTATYFRCDTNKLNNHFLLYALQAPFFVKQYTSVMAQSTRFQVPITAQRKFYLILPSKAEQTAIATALSDADALISSLSTLIAKKRMIKQGAMQQLLQPKEGWEVKKLGEIAEIKKGQLITESTRINGNIPVIAGGKTPSYFHNKPNRTGKTITISASGASAGYISFHDYPIFASDCSTIEENENYSIEFLFYLLQLLQEKIYKMQTGGAQPHIHPSDLNPIILAIPAKEEQTRIATILSDMDAEINALETKLEKYRKVKLGMMQNLLTGKIRLL